MTAKLVDEITETPSDKDREARGQGIANVVTGFFGGMAGCAMIGQTMINVKASQARTRISTFCAGAFLLVLVVGLGSVVAVILMGETVIMAVTVAGTVATHNLAIGVGVGVLTAMVVLLDAIGTHYARHRVTVEITGLDHRSRQLHSDLSDQLVAAH